MKSLAASANEQLIPIGQPLAYHYCSAATGLAIVEGQNIWASDYTKMNDPKELKYGVDAMRAVISQT
ncbi:MAG: hypothetical protein ABI439_13570, partial [Rhodospirillales bacterium]